MIEEQEGKEQVEVNVSMWDFAFPVGVIVLVVAFAIAIPVWTLFNRWTVVQRSDGKYSYRNYTGEIQKRPVYDTCESATAAMQEHRAWIERPARKEDPDPFTYKNVRCE